MNHPGRAVIKNVVSGQTMTTLLQGKEYVICDDGQYAYVKHSNRMRIATEAREAKEKLSEEMLDQRLAQWLSNDCTYITVDKLLDKMTPDERQRWKDSYRFSGICHKE